MKRMLTATLTMILTACGYNQDQAQQRLNAQAVPVSESHRVTIERISVFKDDLSFGGKRGVYLIKDQVTKQEFIGVSGVGISEVGQHSGCIGKTCYSAEDER